MEKDYIFEVENMPQDQPICSSIGICRTNSKMIGLSDKFQLLKTELMRGNRGSDHFHAHYGTAGVGKTTLAMQIYQDPDIQSKFECRAWVTIGRVPQPNIQISRGILAQLCGITQVDEEIGEDCLEERLDGKICFIVFDDVWEMDVLHSFLNITYYVRRFHFLLICRHTKWHCDAWRPSTPDFSWYEMRFLNEEESTELLCEKVFGDETCPPQLHKAAVKIAKLCEGLPLTIVTVADILSKSERNRDPTYWNEVAERRNSVFTDAYNQISKVLYPSYDYLPQSLKMPFLFMGVFPQDYDTPLSKIIIMLIIEGLWDKREDWDRLRDLVVYYSLVLRNFKSVDKTSHEHSVSEYKTCRLHSSWRHVCRGEASKTMFYHVLNKLNDAQQDRLKGQRGLCPENNILFGIKEFRELVRFNCASLTRSLLFYGPYHQYPIPIGVGFMLLREIDALTQRFYTFPTEILSLFQLKYLALTCNGELPTTISKLFNLRVLIIHPHMNIRRRGAPSYVPIQIWDMKELEHIEIPGKSLVAPSNAVSMKKLSTLVGVNASIRTILELSRRIAYIKKLGIQIEVTPYDDHNDLLSCFDCISAHACFETLNFSITNPVVKYGHVFPVTLGSFKLPLYLIKLHLSGTGFPWEYLDVIGSLPVLEVLKLRSYAVWGSHWETKRNSFRSLKFLLIEESELVQWKLGHQSLAGLKYLSMKHCYKLEEISMSSFLDQHECTIEIELEDCNPLALTWATQLQPSVGVRLRVIASSSLYEKPTTIKYERYGGDCIPKWKSTDNEEEEENDDEETEVSANVKEHES